MSSKLRLKSMTVTFLMIVVAFAAGMAANQLHFAKAEPRQDAYANQVLEILAGGSPTGIYSQPNPTDPNTTQLDVVLWGDRVLWDGVTSQQDSGGNRWIKVSIAEGQTGWMVANIADVNVKLKISTAVYTTPGIAIGKTITVTQAGDNANFRTEPTVIPGAANRIRGVTAGETLTVLAGPYQAEYFIWWQFQDASGQQGWIVDIEDWFQVNP